MQKLNNKGLTLIELIVSVTLVSIVLIFLTRLLSNVTYESDNEFFASENQEERIEITDYIHTILRRYDINNPRVSPGTNSASITLTQSGYGTTEIIITKSRIQVYKTGVILRTWNLKTGFFVPSKVICEQGATITSYVPWRCNIPVYTINDENNVDNNNTLDDITLSFLVKS